jgi:hypothetical protein
MPAIGRPPFVDPPFVDEVAALDRFLGALSARGIAHAVVGDVRGIADGIVSDVDIVVETRGLSRVEAIVRRFAREHRVALVQDIQHEIGARYFVLSWIVAGMVRFLHLDICSDYRRDGRLFLRARQILAGRRTTVCRGVLRSVELSVPRPAVNFIYYLLKKIDKGALDPVQADLLAAEYAGEPHLARRLLRRHLPRSAELVSAAAQDNEWHPIIARIDKLRHELRQYLPSAIPDLRELARIAIRCARPTGLAVVMLGIDAADFHRAAEATAASWIRAFRGVISRYEGGGVGRLYRWFHLRPAVTASKLVVVGAPALSERMLSGAETLTLSAGDCRTIGRVNERIQWYLHHRLRTRPCGIYLA